MSLLWCKIEKNDNEVLRIGFFLPFIYADVSCKFCMVLSESLCREVNDGCYIMSSQDKNDSDKTVHNLQQLASPWIRS